TMQNTGLSFVVCFNDIDEKVDQFVEAISADFQVYVDRGVELITVRHYQKDLLEELVSGKVVLMEERIKDTAQMVVKTVPRLKLKS
ncbi:MAG: aspartate kinase, partial [Saprospiraceae bacterium]|nr:aspartate kinase [Saprospiraceae bacterium]